jgi:hypothetical protein
MLDRNLCPIKQTPIFRLPCSVNMSPHTQDIYREAFDRSFAAHWGDPRQEEIAHA